VANEIAETGGGRGLPEVPTFVELDPIWAELDAVRTDVATAYQPSAELLTKMDHAIAAANHLRPRISAASQPISRGDLAIHLGLLLKSFVNAGQQDAAVFGRFLRDDVLSLEPSVGAIDLACRRWRRKSKFLPAIAEMMDEVRAAQSQIEGAVDFLLRLPALRAEHASRLNSP